MTREEAIQVLKRTIAYESDFAEVKRMAIEALSADRPTGEWIEHEWAEEVEGLLISNYECSKCHSLERNARNFCPNCGADMRGEEHERKS